ncbi:hypothetical protein FRACYDRAFT_246709 [Fragilariopsis cylindrus CCMP1102]|uniref:Uncharacterized protein n=1 Tax=Fragilariopsis cylindrus CCMP1102 TaxID=635003 RepID=A0A1E7EY92_9STRA|nr:hypothetical protein FRACYDRAFT_246709 [Fragilariopsis cylindrus CCMP1102]|eukprot:OEU10837.1 hypothetical protein FRACYDRAFT_246709 [Fragilariopsis cylindrus CCMP1102]
MQAVIIVIDQSRKIKQISEYCYNPTFFERLFVELEKYNELSTLLGWMEESSKAIGTTKRFRFIEDFGIEKVKLEETLSIFRMVFTSLFGLSIDSGDAMLESSTYYVRAYKDAIKQYGKGDAIVKVLMPNTLTDPSHWGYFAWKYIKLCDSKNLDGLVLEFGENADSLKLARSKYFRIWWKCRWAKTS